MPAHRRCSVLRTVAVLLPHTRARPSAAPPPKPCPKASGPATPSCPAEPSRLTRLLSLKIPPSLFYPQILSCGSQFCLEKNLSAPRHKRSQLLSVLLARIICTLAPLLRCRRGSPRKWITRPTMPEAGPFPVPQDQQRAAVTAPLALHPGRSQPLHVLFAGVSPGGDLHVSYPQRWGVCGFHTLHPGTSGNLALSAGGSQAQISGVSLPTVHVRGGGARRVENLDQGLGWS